MIFQIYNKSVEETNLFKIAVISIFDTCLEQVHTRYRILSDSFSLTEIEVYPINPKLRSRVVAVTYIDSKMSPIVSKMVKEYKDP